jgi:hypothetical protein
VADQEIVHQKEPKYVRVLEKDGNEKIIFGGTFHYEQIYRNPKSEDKLL